MYEKFPLNKTVQYYQDKIAYIRVSFITVVAHSRDNGEVDVNQKNNITKKKQWGSIG